MLVVIVQTAVELAAAFGFGGVAADVGPAVGQGAVAAFELPVGLPTVQLGALVRDAELGAGGSPQVRLVVAAIVGQDPLDGTPAVIEPLNVP